MAVQYVQDRDIDMVFEHRTMGGRPRRERPDDVVSRVQEAILEQNREQCVIFDDQNAKSSTVAQTASPIRRVSGK